MKLKNSTYLADMARLITPAPFPTASWRRSAPKTYASSAPRPFSVYPTLHDKAIIYPWLAVDESFDALRYSLRSVDMFFEDKECPIYIIGNGKPRWLDENHRVKWINVPEYKQSRQEGLWKAWQIGLQIAEEIIWMNDDIYFLRPTVWDDMRVALTEGVLDEQEPQLRTAHNSWRRSLGDACADLRSRGFSDVHRFATHTPFLFEREKSLEIMREYHVPFCGAWETLYHNHHQTPHEPCAGYKVSMLPAPGNPRYLNHKSHGPDKTTRDELVRLLSTQPPWEMSKTVAFPVIGRNVQPALVSMASFPPRILGLERAVKDILPQCDGLRIYLNGYNEVPNCIPDDDKISIVLAGPNSSNPDLGSHGKWHWLGYEDCYHLTIDDDILYAPGYVKHMIEGCRKFKDRAIISLHGYQFKFLRNGRMMNGMPIQRMRAMRPYQREYKDDYPAHALGSGVMCCRPSVIGLTKDAFCGAIHTGDDEDLALWCQTQKVPMIRVSSPAGLASPNDLEWRKEPLHARESFHRDADKKLRAYKNWTIINP